MYLQLEFALPLPKSRKPGLCPVRPDLDNLGKAVMDALSKAKWWRDDAQVACLVMTKRWDASPGVTIVARGL